MILYANDLIDLLDAYNENRDPEYQMNIFDVLEEIDDVEDDRDIKIMMKEIENRI